MRSFFEKIFKKKEGEKSERFEGKTEESGAGEIQEKNAEIPEESEVKRDAKNLEFSKKEADFKDQVEIEELTLEGIDRKKGLRLNKAVMGAMLLMSLWAATGGSAEKAHARDFKRSAERTSARVLDNIGRGLGKGLEDVIRRGITGEMSPEEKRQEKEYQRERQNQSREQQRNRQRILDNYQRELNRAKTQKDMELAKDKMNAALKALEAVEGTRGDYMAPRMNNLENIDREENKLPDTGNTGG